MKNLKNSYTVDFTNSKIIATASFMEKAGQYGSDEYRTIMSLRKDLPTFDIEVLKEKKPSMKKGSLNLDTMEAYILHTCGESSLEIMEFRKICETSKVEKAGRYSYMKKWFHEVYPEGYKLLCELKDLDAKKQIRQETAKKIVENYFTMRDVVSRENNDETKETTADYEESAVDPK